MNRQLVSFTDRQLATLRHAAGSLPEHQRACFMRDVAKHLVGEPSDAELDVAIRIALAAQSVDAS